MRVEDFEAYYQKQKADSNCGFAEEFEVKHELGAQIWSVCLKFRFPNRILSREWKKGNSKSKSWCVYEVAAGISAHVWNFCYALQDLKVVGTSQAKVHALNPSNKPKNRYNNVLPCESPIGARFCRAALLLTLLFALQMIPPESNFPSSMEIRATITSMPTTCRCVRMPSLQHRLIQQTFVFVGRLTCRVMSRATSPRRSSSQLRVLCPGRSTTSGG